MYIECDERQQERQAGRGLSVTVRFSVELIEIRQMTIQNDFLALSRAFSLPDIDYHDISRREQLTAALKRWPLLAELAEKK